MDLRKLQRIVVDALDDIKGQDIKVFNTSEQTAEFDRVVIATGQSNRQTRSLADHVCDKARDAGVRVLSREGDDTGEWVLVDLGDVIVHVMQPDVRAYYNLEEIWGAKPVRIRVGPPATARRGTETASRGTPATSTQGARTRGERAAAPATKAGGRAAGAAAQRAGGREGRAATPAAPAGRAGRPGGSTRKAPAAKAGKASTGAARKGPSVRSTPAKPAARTARTGAARSSTAGAARKGSSSRKSGSGGRGG
ncbi:MAG: ribosome silencing factor [Burkholderiaceae bacterium]